MLDGDIDWLTSEVLEGETEITRIIIQTVTAFQEGEHLLELVEHIIINKNTILGTRLHVGKLTIISHQYSISKGRSEKELLEHGNHVADAP